MLTLKMAGSVAADPTLPTSPEAFSPAVSLDFRANYQGVFGGSEPISGTFVPDLGGLTAVRALAVRAVDGQSLLVKLTSAGGVDQVLPVSDLLVWRGNNPGDEITGIKIVGTGRVEFLLAGDSGGTGSFAPAAPSVADLASLAAISSTLYGLSYRVRTLRAPFYLDPSSVLAADGISIVTAIPAGRWIRVPPGDTFWQIQTAWFYDAVGGDNEASGLDVGNPIRDMSEIWRRVAGATVLTDVALTIAGGPQTLSDPEIAIFEALSAGSRQWSVT